MSVELFSRLAGIESQALCTNSGSDVRGSNGQPASQPASQPAGRPASQSASQPASQPAGQEVMERMMAAKQPKPLHPFHRQILPASTHHGLCTTEKVSYLQLPGF